jgi:hypothetical protein
MAMAVSQWRNMAAVGNTSGVMANVSMALLNTMAFFNENNG